MLAEGAVVGAEVVAPGADAVGLVDGDEGGLAAGEHLGEAGDADPLGRDEEEVERAGEVVAAGLCGRRRGRVGVDAGDAQTGGGELGGLVVHERDERDDDQRGAAAGDGGKLVAERLAGAGGHDKQRVAAVDDGAADGFLIGAEGGETEVVWRRAVRSVMRVGLVSHSGSLERELGDRGDDKWRVDVSFLTRGDGHESNDEVGGGAGRGGVDVDGNNAGAAGW